MWGARVWMITVRTVLHTCQTHTFACYSNHPPSHPPIYHPRLCHAYYLLLTASDPWMNTVMFFMPISPGVTCCVSVQTDVLVTNSLEHYPIATFMTPFCGLCCLLSKMVALKQWAWHTCGFLAETISGTLMFFGSGYGPSKVLSHLSCLVRFNQNLEPFHWCCGLFGVVWTHNQPLVLTKQPNSGPLENGSVYPLPSESRFTLLVTTI